MRRRAFFFQQAMAARASPPGAARVPEPKRHPQHAATRRPEADTTPCCGGRNWSHTSTIPGIVEPHRGQRLLARQALKHRRNEG